VIVARSIRARLTLWYAGTILAVLLLLSAVLRDVIRRTLDRQFADSLAYSAAMMAQFFRLEINVYGTVERTVTHIAGEVLFQDRVIEFLQPGGARFATGGWKVSTRAPTLVPPVRVYERPLDERRAPGWRIRLRASAAETVRLERAVDRWFLLVAPTSVILAGALGWWLTGRTLTPVGRMADAAARIAAGEGGERLPIADPADELGRMGTRFNALLDRLEAALAQQRRFLADAAHELRTPIARMRGRVELASLAPDPASDRAALDAMAGELARTSTLLGELLLLARADADPRPAVLAPGYLDDVVLDVLNAFAPVARTVGVALDVEAVDETPARLDAELVHRLASVLVDNAVRYTPPGGRVRVRVGREHGHAVLEVRDTGIGITPEEQERLFERFFRGAAARACAPDGSGLGLPIARWIAREHGGELTLAPAPEGGTVARLELPALTVEPATR
jgi:two-component system, OmpR family, sensor kinase